MDQDIHSIKRTYKVTRQLGSKYEWLCIKDPTGNFFLRVFRREDIEIPHEEHCCWPDGIIFQNIYTPERKVIHDSLVKTEFDLMTRCKVYWALYSLFAEISNQVYAERMSPRTNVELHRSYQAALADLRSHIKVCPECKKGMRTVIDLKETSHV